MTAATVEALLSELREDPQLKSYVDSLAATLQREEKARQVFRGSLREDVRAEFINGRVVVQVPARHRHTVTIRNVATLLDTHVKLKRLGAVCSEQAIVEFPRNDYGPDICFWKRAVSRHFEPDQVIYPIPTFVCEVLSPSTARIDRGVKFNDYQANGVEEYWIVDPDPREMIEQWVRRAKQYELVGRFNDGVIRSHAVKGFRMPVRAAFDEAENLASLKRMLARS